MSSQRDQQKEVVRLLVLQHGQKIASELSEVPYETVRKWTQRGNWLASQNVPSTNQPAKVAADNLTVELQEHENQSRLSLARSVTRISKDAESATLRDVDKVHKVAQTMAIVHRQGEHGTQQGFTLNVLNMGNLEVTVTDPDTQS